MALDDGLRRLRVRPPLESTPVGLQGCRPPDERPSPPPMGCATGFMATPRTCGLRPIQRLRPAFPIDTLMWSELPIVPIVARQLLGSRRTSPEGRVICAHLPSRALTVAWTPAVR